MRKLFALLALAIAFPAFAQEDIPASPIAKAQLLLHAPAPKKDESILAGVLFTLPEGWHIYWRNPGDSGIPTSLAWDVPTGISISDVQWPLPERIETAGLVNYGYGKKVIFPIYLTPYEDKVRGPVRVKAEWLVCKDICIPESAELTGELPATSPQAQVLLSDMEALRIPELREEVGSYTVDDERVLITFPAKLFAKPELIHEAHWYPVQDGVISNAQPQTFRVKDGQLHIEGKRGSAQPPSEWEGVVHFNTPEHGEYYYTIRLEPSQAAAPAATKTAKTAPLVLALPLALLFAFLGGVILNAMPCVLPILSLKALALAKKSGIEQRAARAQGLAYTAGVIASFLAIAGLMLALKSAGAAIGWGFQLQEPAVIAGLYFLMLLVALNLFGLFELPVLFGNRTSDAHSVRGAFLTGALAVMLATPCTAPFMAPAIGATLGMPALHALLVFAALGLGMAAPFLLISLVPAARRLLPKPGVWMARFKQFLAFPMLATAGWLLWVLNHATGDSGLLLALAGGLIVAWLLWWAHGTTDRGVRRVLLVAAALVIAWAVAMQPNPNGVPIESGTEPYNAERLAALRAEGRPVFIDATADWCLSCKINERFALKNDSVEQLFREKNVVMMVADWTHRDAAITALLESFNRNGVPLYVYYGPHAEPKVLPQLITPAIVRDAINGNE